jgi:precorrin-2 dehydrogenase/sirohydrochlorin ferrochelatase
MHYFPVCLRIAGRRCIVIGGGRVGERKALALLEYGAQVTVISPELTGELVALQRQGRLAWLARGYEEGDLAAAFLVIAATDDPLVQERVHAEAEVGNILLNVADVPRWCNFILPATVRQGDLSLAISTSGRSPALASRLRRELEGWFGPEYAVLLDILGGLREQVLAGGRPHPENKEILGRLAEPQLAVWIREGHWDRIAGHIREVLGPEAPLDGLAAARAAYRPVEKRAEAAQGCGAEFRRL